jgi:hypothetical protein
MLASDPDKLDWHAQDEVSPLAPVVFPKTRPFRDQEVEPQTALVDYPCTRTRKEIRVYAMTLRYCPEVERVAALTGLHDKLLARLEEIADALPPNLADAIDAVISDGGYCPITQKHLILHVAKHVRSHGPLKYHKWALSAMAVRRLRIRKRWKARCKRLKELATT